MRRTGTAAALALLVALAGCGGGDASTPTASSVAPTDMPACGEIYAEGVAIDNENFGLACVKDEDLVSPRPIRLECTDGRTLMFNDLAWGYYGEPMTITADDDPSKMPEREVDECLQPSGADPVTPGDGEAASDDAA
jgi:hypothetical protein